MNANQSPGNDSEKSATERAAKDNLRKALDGLELTPEQTDDDQVSQQSQDEQILRDVPPHHN